MGIQISGLLSGQAFDWKSVVDQLIAADSIPVTNLQNQQVHNSSQVSALGTIQTALQALQDSVQSIRANNPFQNRTVASDNAASTWKATSTAGAAVGSYTFDVQTLATATTLTGGGHIGQNLNATSPDLSLLTVGSLPTANQVTGTTFTVNGQVITFGSGDSLKSVLDKITANTGGDVTWSYNSTTDGITLTSGSGKQIVLGSGADTSNFLQVMKLANNGTSSVSSSGTLGTVSTSATLVNARLGASITNVDGSGNGTFDVNGIPITYNINTDSITSVINKINGSKAGVTASYDSANDRLVLTNNSTGSSGLTVTEGAGGLMDAVKLETAGVSNAATFGKDAKYSLDGGTTWITSATNTLGAASHGINGLTVTVTTTGTQTLTVASDVNSMSSAIQDFITKFNAAQDEIATDTKISTGGGTVQTSILSGNHEVENWATQLQNSAFSAMTGVTGSVTHLDDLGIDFDGTSGHLIVKDQGKFNDALTNRPNDVQNFFVSGASGLVPTLYGQLTNFMSEDQSQQTDLTTANSNISDQITTLQSRLADERTQLTNSFIAMLDAQSQAQSQNTSLTNQFFSNNNSCWVARAVYGESDIRWRLFRSWLLFAAPSLLRWTYLRFGARFAVWVADKPRIKRVLRRWMDARIAGFWAS